MYILPNSTYVLDLGLIRHYAAGQNCTNTYYIEKMFFKIKFFKLFPQLLAFQGVFIFTKLVVV